MDVLAVIVSCLAVLVFIFDWSISSTTWRIDSVRLGLALVTFALICQFTALTEHHWHT